MLSGRPSVVFGCGTLGLVIFELFVLALASTVRPTSIAAVYALRSHDERVGLLCAYVVGGLVFTLAFGALVVGVLHGFHLRLSTGTTRAVTDIVAGAAALIFGAAVLQRRIGGVQTDDAPKTEGRLTAMLARRLTIPTAALAGPVTHVPGIFYLVALNLIVAHNIAAADQAIALVTYNAIWFVLPIAALVLCIADPDAARTAIASVNHWTRDHAREIVLVTSFVVGAALVIRGLIAL
jgi:Sap, sulfolipid-1-addressing protein